jgi:hypothetical protein
LFIDIMKANDIIPPNYDDEAAKTEIMEDELITGPPTNVEELDMEALAQKTQNQGAPKDANL